MCLPPWDHFVTSALILLPTSLRENKRYMCRYMQIYTCVYVYSCAWMCMFIIVISERKQRIPHTHQLPYHLNPLLLCSCDKEFKGISMCAQTKQDASLQHPASASQPTVFETSRLQRPVIQTLTAPNTRLSTCHCMERAGRRMHERSPQVAKQEASPSLPPPALPCERRTICPQLYPLCDSPA